MGLLDQLPPLLPFKEGAFTSRLRSAQVTSKIGIALAACIAICFLTGLWSHYQQHPLDWVTIPTAPVWGYRLSQGLHVATGIAAIPLLLLKLWSVYPRLFEWPPVKSAGHALERMFIAVLVAAMIFQLATGLINISQWYPWTFPFTQTHFAISFVILGALFIHLAVKAPQIVAALQERASEPSALEPSDPNPAESEPAESEPALAAAVSRRNFFIVAGASVGAVTITTVGQTVTPLEPVAAFAPRVPTMSPQGMPINRTAVAAKITPNLVGNDYRLVVDGPTPLALTIDDLQAMPQIDVDLPIACVEGWSANAQWRGIRLANLLDRAGIPPESAIQVVSLETNGNYGTSVVAANFARDPLTVMAMRINDEELSLDHGYPIRLVAPNRPGVLQTKWINRIEVIS
ncbi:MAG: molybdopterin-dependent oxidoreductase [Actinobacteria bacterium]|nr:molybdopterin-dependent oxidoreductase [Actinomycetota bacterium]